MRRASLKPTLATLLSGALLVTFASGCGSTKTFRNDPRPAAPIVVTAAITPAGVTVSPSHFGAGLVQFVVANLTSASQQLTVQSTAKSFQQQTGPINPQDTAELKADLGQGVYLISTSTPGLKAATLAVGKPRPTSNDQLLQP
jgi:hypothetical protein